jgi:sortase (surface protein transpeptidase)
VLWASVTLGLALLVGTPLAWHQTRPELTIGEPPAASVTPNAQVSQPPADPSPAAPVTAAGPLRGPLTALPTPTRISIPAIAVDAPIVPVAYEADGSMEIPRDVATIGWFAPGVRPGAGGAAVLSGHVDSQRQGRGAFFRLGELGLGDLVVVIDSAGVEQTWQVTARTRYPKDELPTAEVFAASGPPRLVLITCGGDFDATVRSYSDNVVVFAEPVGEGPTP